MIGFKLQHDRRTATLLYDWIWFITILVTVGGGLIMQDYHWDSGLNRLAGMYEYICGMYIGRNVTITIKEADKEYVLRS